MITKVNDMDLKVLSLFTKGYCETYYIREIAKFLDVSSRTAFVTLAKLEKKGILESELRGRIRLYSIKNSFLSREFFVLTEQYKKIRFFGKNLLIKEVFEKADKFLNGIVLVFGSYAKEIPKKGSDLDLFVVGKFDEKKIKELCKKYGVDINIKSYPVKIFKQELTEDILLKEIMKNHILIKGSEDFVGEVIKWIK